MVKNIEEIKTKLEKIESFKNVTLSFNEEKNIYDVYIRILKDEAEVKDIFNNSKEIEYEYCDFGIFEIMFHPEDTTKVFKTLNKNF